MAEDRTKFTIKHLWVTTYCVSSGYVKCLSVIWYSYFDQCNKARITCHVNLQGTGCGQQMNHFQLKFWSRWYSPVNAKMQTLNFICIIFVTFISGHCHVILMLLCSFTTNCCHMYRIHYCFSYTTFSVAECGFGFGMLFVFRNEVGHCVPPYFWFMNYSVL